MLPLQKKKHRNWRKNRNIKAKGSKNFCGEQVKRFGGVDLNRNFGFKWNGEVTCAKKIFLYIIIWR